MDIYLQYQLVSCQIYLVVTICYDTVVARDQCQATLTARHSCPPHWEHSGHRPGLGHNQTQPQPAQPVVQDHRVHVQVDLSQEPTKPIQAKSMQQEVEGSGPSQTAQ